LRKTLCLKCKQIWEESREIPLEDSQCPHCGNPVIKKAKERE